MQNPVDRYIKIGDVNTHYWAAGDKGPAVILVHGLGGSVENWVKNIGPLAQHYRVFAPDLKGFGRTDKTPVLRDLNELVVFLNDFMGALLIDKASLVGNSLGGGLVLQFAVNYPQKVAKLVLVDTAGMGADVIVDFKVVSLPILGEILIKPSLKGTADLWKKIVFDPSLVTDELVDQAYALACLPGASRALLTTLRAGIGFLGQRARLRGPFLKSVAKLAVPTLVVWGRNDRIIPVAHAQIAVKTIPGARLQLYDRCGHMPQYERPDEFNKLALDFLAG